LFTSAEDPEVFDCFGDSVSEKTESDFSDILPIESYGKSYLYSYFFITASTSSLATTTSFTASLLSHNSSQAYNKN
jgi:hypothetical protein